MLLNTIKLFEADSFKYLGNKLIACAMKRGVNNGKRVANILNSLLVDSCFENSVKVNFIKLLAELNYFAAL